MFGRGVSDRGFFKYAHSNYDTHSIEQPDVRNALAQRFRLKGIGYIPAFLGCDQSCSCTHLSRVRETDEQSMIQKTPWRSVSLEGK